MIESASSRSRPRTDMLGAMQKRVGRYETISVIASGGMATVYLARALGAGGFERLVAIKVMHPHIAHEQEFVDMFLDEARLAARIRHPNVVPMIDVSTRDRDVFLVMDYVEGGSLYTVLRALRKRSRLLPLDMALRIFLDVLGGLHAAHELVGENGAPLNLVHRDVSPQNVLVGIDGVARITDFGIARAEARLSSTRGGQIKGKLGYMSPEQVRSEPIDRRCDVYASSVVLWEMLTGRKAIQADNDGALVQQILAGITESPLVRNPLIPAEIASVCMRALRIPPRERFASAADFADAIEEAARFHGVIIASPRAVSTFLKPLDIAESIPPSSS